MKRQKIQQVADLVPFVSCNSMHTEAFKQKVITLSEYHVFQFEQDTFFKMLFCSYKFIYYLFRVSLPMMHVLRRTYSNEL